MDESDCKLLTTFLGECWHEKPEESYHRQARKRFFLGHICGKCGKAYLNRTRGILPVNHQEDGEGGEARKNNLRRKLK